MTAPRGSPSSLERIDLKTPDLVGGRVPVDTDLAALGPLATEATLVALAAQLPAALVGGRLAVTPGPRAWEIVANVALVGVGSISTGVLDLAPYDRIFCIFKNGDTATRTPVSSITDPSLGLVTIAIGTAAAAGSTTLINSVGQVVSSTLNQAFFLGGFPAWSMTVASFAATNAGSRLVVYGCRVSP